MKKLLRLLLYTVLALLVLVGGGLGVGSWYVLKKLDVNTWADEAEKSWNCRVEVGDSTLSLFTRPATLVLKRVKFAPRDAEMTKPRASRTPLAAGAAPIEIAELMMDVKREDLLNQKLSVERLRILEPLVKETQDAEGKSSLQTLFKKPEVPGAPSEAKPVHPPGSPEALAEEKKKAAFAYAVSTASLENGRLVIVNKDTTVTLEKLNFRILGFDLDPKDPAAHNLIRASLSCHINVQGLARIGGAKRPAQLADLTLEAESQIRPVDPATGKWSPVSALKMRLAKGSMLAGHITMGDVAGKEMMKLLEYGVDLRPVRAGGPLIQDSEVEAIFADNRLTLLKPTFFAFPDYEVVIEPQSWVNSSQDLHAIELRLSCGLELQQRIQKGVAEAKLGDSLAGGIIQALSDDRGRMTFDIESSGSLSDPKVRPKIDRVLENLLKGRGLEGLLKGLLKKL